MAGDQDEFWYHCGRCGSLFRDGSGESESRTCGICSQNPAVGLWPFRGSNSLEEEDNLPVELSPAEAPAKIKVKSTAKASRRRPRGRPWLLAVLAWLTLMVVAVFTHHFVSEKKREAAFEEKRSEQAEANLLTDRKAAELADAARKCLAALTGFLAAESYLDKTAYTLGSEGEEVMMKLFFQNSPFPEADGDALEVLGAAFLSVGNKRMVKLRLQNTGEEKFEAVFAKKSGKWKLDWKHFVRYSEEPFQEFIRGEGADTALFRLLATPGAVDESSVTQKLQVTFFPADLDSEDVEKEALHYPEFKIAPRSEEGLVLDAAFKDEAQGKALFSDSIGNDDVKGLIRVRVILKRESAGSEFIFKLDELLGCHWLEDDTLGYDVGQLRYGLFEN